VVLSGLEDQLAPLRSWLFPRRVYLQLEDQAFTAMVLDGESVAWQERVPLPEGLCVNGEPQAVEALGDLLGDWLVERGFPGARVKAVLPRDATAWRVIEWPDAAWPEHPELVVREQQQELDLPWSLQDADVFLEPLPGAQPRSLLVAVQRSLLEAWIAVCSQAGVALEAWRPCRFACAVPCSSNWAMVCRWCCSSNRIRAGCWRWRTVNLWGNGRCRQRLIARRSRRP